MTYDEVMRLPAGGHKKGHSGGGFSGDEPTEATQRKKKKSMQIK
jgi:hypothetical protein